MKDLQWISNPDLTVDKDNEEGNKARWNTPECRRHGFHNLHRNNRYGMVLRSPRVLQLQDNHDLRTGQLPEVKCLQSNPAFSGMVVVRGQDVLHERYAEDFGPQHPHSIQSITKLLVNLIIGSMWESGDIDLDQKIGTYLPQIGSGYQDARIQDVLDMNIENSYTEDYDDPHASSYDQETTIGWRLNSDREDSLSQMKFLQTITSDNLENTTGQVNYKSANTDVLGYLIERASGKSLRQWILEIIEATGIEGAFYCSTDRYGFPVVDGGGCMTTRDLARLGLLFARKGLGINGKQAGSKIFIEQTLRQASLSFAPPRHWMKYRNQAFTNGFWIGHSGYGGQFLLVDPGTGISCAFFSVLENESAYDVDYSVSMIQMLEKASGLYR